MTTKEWPVNAEWKVTGVDTNNRRFRILTSNGHHALGINLWRGTVWCKVAGKWRVVQSVYN
jgi:hypothetical protein